MQQVEPVWLKPEAERFLREGDFKRLLKCSPTPTDAFGLFASRQIERYSLEHVTHTCCDCGRGAEGHVVRVEWDYRLPSISATAMEALGAIGHVHVDHHSHWTFGTFHPLCGRCMRRWRIARVAGAVVLVPAVLGVAFGLGMGVLGSIILIGGTFSPSDQRLLAASIPKLFAAAALGLVLWRIATWLRIPRPLRRVAGPPIELKKMKHRPVTEWRGGMGLDRDDC